MQWILQDFEDTAELADTLDRLGLSYSIHKVVPFVGDLLPEPEIPNPQSVVLFGAYTLWRYAEARQLSPGVFRIRPFVHEKPWQPYLLNGTDALFMTLREVPDRLPVTGKDWFLRPVDDSKAEPGRVRRDTEIVALAQKVFGLGEDEIPSGALRHDTELMLTEPARIRAEWRIWVVGDEVVTYSLYKDGARVTYRPEIDPDALAFASQMVAQNPGYARAYVMDICRTDEGLRLLETNCVNAAGFYAADLEKLVMAIEGV